MAYGYDAQGRNDDRLVKVSRELVQFGTRIILPGALLVNNIPFRERSALYQIRLAEKYSLSTIHSRMAFVVQL
jgi:hypothetical protein